MNIFRDFLTFKVNHPLMEEIISRWIMKISIKYSLSNVIAGVGLDDCVSSQLPYRVNVFTRGVSHLHGDTCSKWCLSVFV